MGQPPAKTCTRCRHDKPHADFHAEPRNRDGVKSWCKACTIEYAKERYRQDPAQWLRRGSEARRRRKKDSPAAYNAKKKWRENNPEKNAAAKRAWWLANAEYRKDWHLRQRHGIGVATYWEMLATQGGACAICKTTKPGGNGTRMLVDHDHATNKLRGLLCHHCNAGLGHFFDDESRLHAAVEYLRKHTKDDSGGSDDP